MRCRFLLLALAPLLLGNAEAELSPPTQAMLDAAMATDDPARVTVVAETAAKAFPEEAAAIATMAATWQAKRAERERLRVREAGVLDLVTGRVRLGGFRTSGNTDTAGLAASADLKREGIDWRHKLRLEATYQESNGVASRERYSATYEPNYKIDPRAYLYGSAQFESDRFLGYTERYSVSLGGGFSVLTGPKLRLSIEAGPGFRHTDFTDRSNETSLAARASADFRWQVAPTVTLTQVASAYVQNPNSTVSSRSALSSKLLGPLSAELSYDVQYESNPTPGRTSTDTTSRVSLLVDF